MTPKNLSFVLVVILPVAAVGLLLVAPLITVGVVGTFGVIAIGRVRAGGLGLPLRVACCVAAVVATVIVACRYLSGDNRDQRSEEVENGGREFHDEVKVKGLLVIKVEFGLGTMQMQNGKRILVEYERRSEGGLNRLRERGRGGDVSLPVWSVSESQPASWRILNWTRESRGLRSGIPVELFRSSCSLNGDATAILRILVDNAKTEK